MSQVAGYAEDWAEIALNIKRAAGYRCSRCDRQCLPATNSYRHLDLSLRRALSAQVHHIDGNPGNNHLSNLVCLCAGCHLRMHRHHSVPTPGQLALKLNLPKIHRLRRGRVRRQLAFTDLIDKLPRLERISSYQIELEL
jgi:5-methylcytosine-specific restriction endonuclease McrA